MLWKVGLCEVKIFSCDWPPFMPINLLGVTMKVIFEDIESPPGCLLTIGGITLLFDCRSDAEIFLNFLSTGCFVVKA